MMKTFRLDILAAEKPFFRGECTSLVIPVTDGQYGIQAMHSNMIAAIIPGILKYKTSDGKEIVAAVSEGMVKVEDNTVLILADTVELPEEIDENRARLARDNAKEAMLQKRSIREYYTAQAEISRAISRLKVKDYGSR